MKNADLSGELEYRKKQMMEIIGKAHLEEAERMLLLDLFSELLNYSRDHLDVIKDTVETQLHNELGYRKRQRVVTALVKNNMVNKLIQDKALVPVCKYPELGVFYDGSYDEFRRICDQSGKYEVHYRFKSTLIEQKAPCRLVPDMSYVNQEDILCRMAQQYGIEGPYLFSPYARKFARIEIKGIQIDPEEIATLTITGNGVDSEKLRSTTEYTLMWNLQMEKSELQTTIFLPTPTDRISPYFETLHYRKTFIREDEKVYPLLHLREGMHACFIPQGDNVYISSDMDLADVEYDKLTILTGSIPENVHQFKNYFNPHILLPERLRSAADIRYVITSFNDNPFGITIKEDFILEDVSSLGEYQTIKNYIQGYTYYSAFQQQRREDEFTRKARQRHSSLNCILQFSGGKAEYGYLAEDYANYVLEYLNDRYPEFCWQGVLA